MNVLSVDVMTTTTFMHHLIIPMQSLPQTNQNINVSTFFRIPYSIIFHFIYCECSLNVAVNGKSSQSKEGSLNSVKLNQVRL